LEIADHHDAVVAPPPLSLLQEQDILFAFGDAACDSEKICKAAEEKDIFFCFCD
jgi:hypothetical protein